MTEELKDPSLKDSARRKLVRGAFAAPAVLTLHNGSAAAATSAANCLVRQNENAKTMGSLTSGMPGDTYFRYRLRVLKNGGGVIKGYWIAGADLVDHVRASQTPFVPNGSWWEFDPAPGANKLVGNPYTTTNPVKSGWSFEQKGPWVSLRVSATGKLVGAGATGTGSAVGFSCWSSFATQTLTT